MSVTRHPPVLYAEDNPDDVFFMRRAFEQVGIPNALIIVNDGCHAIEYLEQAAKEKCDDNPLPCLVLLDLNLPMKTGLEVLQWVRQHPAFTSLTVVIVSASGLQSDIDSATKLGVTDYVIKPSSPTALIALVRDRTRLWLSPLEK